jgi:UDP-N-acetylglucosamine diphosphorylase / glucose-1-phosphate thymidylyltransferase / UDP-N-acetylgalactosamine diphosphorylase / glucosamine-1-phosphate N-acetyltransferase / galactosamine-1-phosphate N-acetyltransferase
LTDTRLVLFDDARARAWAPFSLTRPAGEILFGAMTLRARAERATGLACTGYLTSGRLSGFEEPGSPGVLTPARAGELEGRRLLLSSRCALDLERFVPPVGPATLVLDGATVGWVLPPGTPMPDEAALLDPQGAAGAGTHVTVRGLLVEAPWTLVRDNPNQLREDARALGWEDTGTPSGVHRIGVGLLSLAADAGIEPGVTIDLRAGPVRLEAGARVEGPARLVGPLYIGRSSIVFGGHVGSSSVGPVCKVRGEIADSVVLGYVNKAHDGYLGHALVGRWVNLGAFTTNSDLKNNYGSVSVWTPDGPTDTGLMKVGCFLGDHVKTGIGTVLNTGTVIGAGSNVFGGRMPPSHVPPFSWGEGADLTDYRLDKFLEGAERAMARRDVPLTEGMRGVLEGAWQASADERRRGP